VKQRLDIALFERGFFDSREKARRAIMAGLVKVDSLPSPKPGTPVGPDAVITVAGREKYVGRGGLKLEAALDAFAIDPSGMVCLDVGASTGGFTDCLLQRGAARVHAIDVGHGQLAWSIREDPRVVVREGVNARHLDAASAGGDGFALAVIDVSFISLTLILPPVFALLVPEASVIALIKPQFELTPDRVGKGGVVRDPGARLAARDKIRDFATAAGHAWLGCIDSPVPGREGNVEFLARIGK